MKDKVGIGEWDIIAEKRQAHAREFLKKYLICCKGNRVLDVGSGLATLAMYVASLDKSYVIDCVELSDEMNKIAQENIRGKGLEGRIKIIKTDAKNMALPSNSYDIVMCCDLLHHIENPAYVINEIARVVKPDGNILIRDILRPRSQEELERIIKERAKDLGNNATDKTVRESAMAAFTLEEVSEIFRQSNLKGYKITREEDYQGYLPHVLILRI